MRSWPLEHLATVVGEGCWRRKHSIAVVLGQRVGARGDAVAAGGACADRRMASVIDAYWERTQSVLAGASYRFCWWIIHRSISFAIETPV